MLNRGKRCSAFRFQVSIEVVAVVVVVVSFSFKRRYWQKKQIFMYRVASPLNKSRSI